MTVRSVLLVDDYELQLSAWSRDLAATGRRVFAATSVASAVEIARREPVDLAIVDLFLGIEDGLVCVRALKALRPTLIVIVVSADMSVAYAMEAVRAGASDVLVKPILAADLVARVESGTPADLQRSTLTLEEVEWEHISRALIESESNITQAAERLGIYRQTLQRKLRKRSRERTQAP